jgi:hypothetical protein
MQSPRTPGGGKANFFITDYPEFISILKIEYYSGEYELIKVK